MTYITMKPFTAAQYREDFGPTQMVDWLTACGVYAERDALDGSNGEGPLQVHTALGLKQVPFHHWVIPVSGIGLIVPPDVFAELFGRAEALDEQSAPVGMSA